MRPTLIGIDNPHSSHPNDALIAWPTNATGWRLWKMLNERTGASKMQYANAFNRLNLCDGVMIKTGSTAVLLGDKVRQHFKLPKVLIHPIVRDGVTYRQVPHPSGRCLFYNDPVQRSLVALLLEELYRG